MTDVEIAITYFKNLTKEMSKIADQDDLFYLNKSCDTAIKALQENAELNKQLKLALSEAVISIYLNDNSDYLSALWDIVRILNPEAAELLESNENMAVDKYGQ